MTSFWLWTIALLVLASVFIFLPLFKIKERDELLSLDADEARQRQNVSIYKERLAELEQDLAEGRLTQDDFQKLKQEMELGLLSDVAPDKPSYLSKGSDVLVSAPNNSGLMSIVFLAFVGIAAYLTYFELGSYDKLVQKQTMQFSHQEVSEAQRMAEQGDMSGLLSSLHEKLKNAPDNIEGWMLLSRTAMNMEQFDLAVEGFENVIEAIEKQGENPAPIYGLLAQAHYFSELGQSQVAKPELSQIVQSAIDKAMELDANETNSLGLLAIHSFDNQEYMKAADYWQKILTISPDHAARESIQSGIMRARELAGVPVRPIDSTTQVASSQTTSQLETGQARIDVRVSLAPDLASSVSPDDIVFIFARSESGPPMPLAASRHRVSELPISISLSDANAMGPMAKLSQVESANIVARVSKSGQPIAQPGDLEGKIQGVGVFDGAQISVEINSRL